MLVRHKVFLLAAYITFFMSSCSTSVRHKFDYTSYISNNSAIAIPPPKVEVNLVDLSCKRTRMYDYENFLERIISEAVVSELNKHNLRGIIISRKEIHDKKLKTDFSSIIDKTNEIVASAYVKDKKRKNLQHLLKDNPTISDNIDLDVQYLSQKTKSDIIAVIEYDHSCKTNGARIKDIIIDATLQTQSTPSDNVVFSIAFIDLKTGHFLWSNVITSAMGPWDKKNEVRRIGYMVKKLLSPLP